MIMRGGGGAAGLGGAAGICVTLLGDVLATLLVKPTPLVTPLGAAGTAVVDADGGVARGGTAIGGAALDVSPDGAAGVAGGGVFGGITTTDGGRYVAATEAGVTSLGVDGDCGGAGAAASAGGFGGTAFGAEGAAGVADAAGASTLVSTAGGFATGRAAGGSMAALRCWMARRTSPGCEMCERSILVLISSSLAPLP